jgi:two-component system CheB/CheR fusion protein
MIAETAPAWNHEPHFGSAQWPFGCRTALACPIRCDSASSKHASPTAISAFPPRFSLRHDSRVHLMALVVAGHANKVIAGRLGISQRTVENHRARVMYKMKVRVLADLVRMASAIDIDKWSRGLTAPVKGGSG